MLDKKSKLSLFIIIFVLTLSLGCGAADADGLFSVPKAQINAVYCDDGYFQARYMGDSSKKIKVLLDKGQERYTYDLRADGENETFPFQLGDGEYKIRIMENTTGNRYATLLTATVGVKLKDPNSPFLIASQLIDFSSESKAVEKAAELSQGAQTDLDKVGAIYNYILSSITYDTDKAKKVTSGYKPDIDAVLKSKKGICFDYSAVMGAMLRSQKIPAKMVFGYVQPNNLYHAWNEVYIQNVGWIRVGGIYFDGVTWKLMDSTFAAAWANNEKIANFIGDGSNYAKKYVY